MSIRAWVLLFSLLQTFVAAATLPTAMFSTIRRTEIPPLEGGEAFSIDTFHPKSNFTTYGLDGPSVGAENSFANASLEYAARTFLISSGMGEAAFNLTDLRFDSGFTRGDLGYAYSSQLRTNGTLGAVSFDNVRVNMAFKGDRVTAYGTSYTKNISKAYDTLMPDSNTKTYIEAFEGKLNAKPTNSSLTVTENDIGEVWANVLHNVYAVLVEEFHFSPNKLRAPDATEGNVVFMRIFMDELSLLPCNPTVLQARDAWIQADMARYGGVHVCTMYKALASRGLGVAADEASHTGDDKAPDQCNVQPTVTECNVR